MDTSKQLHSALVKLGTPAKAKASAWFFKTGKGQYGYGDKFIGVTVPEQRKIAKQFKELPLSELDKLLKSPWHEDRLTAVLILVGQYKRAKPTEQKKLVQFYLQHTFGVNNWDIVDSSAEIVHSLPTLRRLVKSKNFWERRIAMIATFGFTKEGNPGPALEMAEKLLNDKEDLMHKAVGWMLREVGKRCSPDLLRAFIKQHGSRMPRTTLRYAIEHFSKAERSVMLSIAKHI